MSLAIHDFLQLREELPVIDVRSQGEFASGHMPGAVNIPILNNDERARVGTVYKSQGQPEAIKEGFRLVGPRFAAILEEAEAVSKEHGILVYCWRGGMRSNNFCQLAGMAKIKSRSLEGGYKVYRHMALESFAMPFSFHLIGGSTGSGKSEILRALAAHGEQILDLEKLASHKGSVFGGLLMPEQPTTEQFQNDLFENILKLDLSRRIWIEDESLAIGKIFLPEVLWGHMHKSPIIRMEVAKNVRIDRLVHEYGTADRNAFLEAMTKIVKRLGGQHFKAAKESLLLGDMATTIGILLSYYDKTYLENIEKRKELIQASVPWDGKNPGQYATELITLADRRMLKPIRK